MTENRHIGKIIYALVALALIAMMLFTATVKGLWGLDGTALGAKIVSAASSTGITQEYETKLFDTDTVMTVDILMDEDEWNELLKNAINEQYTACDVVINGETFYNVGIRAKGNTSLTNIANDDTTDRYSFKIEFDKYEKGQTCYGLDKLILNNNYADATNMKEAVVYDMYAYLGADAPLYNYSKISMNGQYIGVYIALEAVEDSFLLRNYGTTGGELYKPENMDFGDGPSDKRHDPPKRQNDTGDASADTEDAPKDFNPDDMPNDFKPGDMPKDFDPSNMPPDFEGGGEKGKFPDRGGGSNLEYTDDDLDSYSTIWNGEVTGTTKKDHQRVVKALKAVSEGDLSTIEEYMDVDNLLKYMAVHEFSVNGDSLSGNMAHNYYLYESNGQLNIIPWDYNLSWGGMFNENKGNKVDQDGRASSDNGGNGEASATSMLNDPIDDSWGCTDFFDILLQNGEYSKRYHEYLQMLVDYVENGGYEKLTSRIHSQIDELVETDPTAFYTYDEYTAAYTMLDEVIALRAASIKGQIEGSIPSTSEGQSSDSSALIDGSGIDTSVMGRMKAGGR